MPDTVESLIRQAIQTLTVPAAEYVPAIPDAWEILERALAALSQPDEARDARCRVVTDEMVTAAADVLLGYKQPIFWDRVRAALDAAMSKEQP
jgi:hypothetical protein